MDMTQAKPTPAPLVDSDLEKMSRDELLVEILRWRRTAPAIKSVCEELADYRQLAPTPGQLKNHIDQTMLIYRETIKKQATQILEMQQFIDELVEDPLQINKRLEMQTGRGSKKRLN